MEDVFFHQMRDGRTWQNGWTFGKLPKERVIFNPKIHVADFGPLNRTFWAWNLKKKKNCNIFFLKKRGGSQPLTQRPFGTFLKHHPSYCGHPFLRWSCMPTCKKDMARQFSQKWSGAETRKLQFAKKFTIINCKTVTRMKTFRQKAEYSNYKTGISYQITVLRCAMFRPPKCLWSPNCDSHGTRYLI